MRLLFTILLLTVFIPGYAQLDINHKYDIQKKSFVVKDIKSTFFVTSMFAIPFVAYNINDKYATNERQQYTVLAISSAILITSFTIYAIKHKSKH